MPKTAHRKRLEAAFKERAELRAAAVAELAESGTLKPNALSNAPKPKAKTSSK